MNLILRSALKVTSSSHIRKPTSIQLQTKMSSEVEKASKAQPDKNVETVFEKIIAKKIPVDIVYEDEHCLVFNDIAPQAPVHFIVLPKKRIAMLDDCDNNDKEVLGHLILTAKQLAKQKLPKGYRLVINNGREGCQSIYYLHLHILGGRQMQWPPG